MKSFWANKTGNSSNISKATKKKECNKVHSKIDYWGLLTNAKLLTVTERLKYISLSFVHNILYYTNVESLKNVLHLTERVRSSKHENTLTVPTPRTEYFKKSASYFLSVTWNSLPSDLRASNVTGVKFKETLYHYLINLRDAEYV